MSLCNPVIVMSEGKKLAEGTPEEVASDPASATGRYLKRILDRGG